MRWYRLYQISTSHEGLPSCYKAKYQAEKVSNAADNCLGSFREPINKFPQYVRYLVQQIKVLCPVLGKLKISQILARAGLYVGASTVGHMLKEKQVSPPAEERKKEGRKGVVTSKRPNHLWKITFQGGRPHLPMVKLRLTA